MKAKKDSKNSNIKNLQVSNNFEGIVKSNSNKNGQIFKVVVAGIVAVGIALSLTGCSERIVVQDAEKIYDTIDSNGEDITIKPQVLDIPGEDFKLVVEYSLDKDTRKKWTITDDKKLYTTVYTKGLPEDTKVYIDNVHTDCSIIASYAQYNGILQDSMDDRIHNSLMLGFPISDSTKYYAINEIEGQNDQFIQGFSYGYNGYHGGEIYQRRRDEFDYLSEGVYGNKVSSSYGILIKKGDNEPYGIDISSDIIVLASNVVKTKDEDGTEYTYVFKKDGTYEQSATTKKVKSK